MEKLIFLLYVGILVAAAIIAAYTLLWGLAAVSGLGL